MNDLPCHVIVLDKCLIDLIDAYPLKYVFMPIYAILKELYFFLSKIF